MKLLGHVLKGYAVVLTMISLTSSFLAWKCTDIKLSSGQALARHLILDIKPIFYSHQFKEILFTCHVLLDAGQTYD